jgi:hypothetical protein
LFAKVERRKEELSASNLHVFRETDLTSNSLKSKPFINIFLETSFNFKMYLGMVTS